MKLTDWINNKLAERQWSMRELARRGNITSSTISDILSEKRTPTYEACIAIADGLGEPRYVVLGLAGLLPDHPDYKMSPEQIEWSKLFEQISEEDKDELWKIGRIKAGKQREKRKSKA